MVADRRGVKVIHGANDGHFEVAGETVGGVRASLAHAHNIPDDAIALVDGQRVTDDFRLAENSVLEFVGQRGVKGAGRKATAAPTDDGDGGDQDADPHLSSMSLAGLAAFIKGRLTSSQEAEQRAILQAHKSAVDLFWAGGALVEARDRCKSVGNGEWKKFKEEQGLADTTANDAIRLFKNAKTPDALKGLGITEAKKKYVYPTKDEDDDPKSEAVKHKPGRQKKTPHWRAGGKRSAVSKERSDEAEVGSSEAPEPDDGVAVAVADPADAVAEALEDIAQQLNEIAQDDLGKVDLKHQVPDRLLKSIQAVAQGLNNIYRRINRDLPNS